MGLVQKWSSEPLSRLASARQGFSLLELLIVVAIVGLLMVGSVPAIRSITQARGATSAAYQLTGALEMARSEAIARRTYTWLALQPQTNAGNLDLRMGLFYSTNGTTNVSSHAPLTRPVLLERVALDTYTAASFIPATPTPADLSTQANGGPFTSGNTTFNQARVLTFSPQGECSTNPAPDFTNAFTPRIAIPLRQTTGTSVRTNDPITVMIDGSVGVPTIYRAP